MTTATRLPVLSCAEASAAEAAFLAGDAKLSWQLMNVAARGVGEAALSLLGRKPDRILVLAGKGNNGADAFLAALHCARAGTEIVAVFAEGGPARAQAQRAWAVRKQGVRIGIVAAANLRKLAAHEFCLIFDGILGQGFRAPLSADLRSFLRDTDKLQGLRIAVDLPSGLGDDATGPAFRADLTVSIGCLKRPLLSPQAARFVGRLRVLEAHEFDIRHLDVVSHHFARLGRWRHGRHVALGRQHRGRHEVGVALRADDRVLHQVVETGGTGRARPLGSEFSLDHG